MKYVYLLLRVSAANLICGLVLVALTALTGVGHSLLTIAVVSSVVTQLELGRLCRAN